MSGGRVRAPGVCGVAGGVGTTTIAASLHAEDRGVYRGGPADIIVCQTTAISVSLAHKAVNTVIGRPVLVVVADGPLRTPAPVRARLTMVQPHVTAVVAMPYVPQWREIDQALQQAEWVMRVPSEQVPKWLRPWATALLQIADAVLPLVEHAPPGAAGGVPSSRPVNGHPVPPHHPGVAGGEGRPGPVVMQSSRPIPPPAAGN